MSWEAIVVNGVILSIFVASFFAKMGGDTN